MNGKAAQNQETDVETAGPPADSTRLLLQFLHERDVVCPACGYNLRNLTQPQCPECSEGLRLMVGWERPRVGLLIATITPSIFSGICGLLLLWIICLKPGAPLPAVLLDLFGLASGVCGVVLFILRDRFMRQPRAVQAGWAFLTWTIHVGLFLVISSSVT